MTKSPQLAGSVRYFASEAAQPNAEKNRAADIFSLGCVFVEIVSIMAGRTLKELYSHMGNDYVYHESLERVAEWLTYLRTSQDSTIDIESILQWIPSMLKDKPKDRPEASVLLSRIAEDTISERSSFFCGICQRALRVRAKISTVINTKTLGNRNHESHSKSDRFEGKNIL
jgi:serine/threonine protein kinase